MLQSCDNLGKELTSAKLTVLITAECRGHSAKYD